MNAPTSLFNFGSPLSSQTKDLYKIPGADVVLRSCDLVDFPTFKSVLSLASPVFAGMFTMDQLPPSVEQQRALNALPVVAVAESSKVIEAILIYCHPGHPFDIEEDMPEDMLAIARAAEKYEMEGVGARLRILIKRSLSGVSDVAVMRVLIIAMKCRFLEEAKAAAILLLKTPLADRPFVSELHCISAADMWVVLHHYWRCVKAVREITPYGLSSRFDTWFACTECTKCHDKWYTVPFGASTTEQHATLWWSEYMEDVSAALTCRPTGSTVLSPTLLNRALSKANQCTRCRRELKRFKGFVDVYATKIDEAVRKVEFLPSAVF